MPYLNDDSLDDVLLVDAVPDFSGGQRSNSPAGNLDQTQYFFGQNVDIKNKLAVTRRGAQNIGSGSGMVGRVQASLFYDVTGGPHYLVAINGKHLFWWNEVVWATNSTDAVSSDSDAIVGLAQLIDTLYIADTVIGVSSWDGTTVSVLSNSGSANTTPPFCNIILSHNSRLFFAGVPTVPDQLTASLALAGSYNNSLLSIRIGAGEGQPITALAPWRNNAVIVFKTKSIYIVTCDPILTSGADSTHGMANAIVTKIAADIGCPSQRGFAIVGDDILFISQQGIRSLNRVFAQTNASDTAIGPAISEPIDDIIQRLNGAYTYKCASFFWSNKFMISVPLDGATECDTVLVFDTLRQSWAGVWTGWTPTCFCLSVLQNAERLNFGQPDGTLLRWLDYITIDSEDQTSFQDNGVDITTEIQCRAFLFGDGFSSKSPLAVETIFYQSRAACTVTAAMEQGEQLPLSEPLFDTAGGVPLLLPFNLPAIVDSSIIKRRTFPALQLQDFREMQVVLTSPADKLSVRAVTAQAFLNPVTIQA